MYANDNHNFEQRIAMRYIRKYTDDVLGGWSNAVMDGDESYKASYKTMAQTIYSYVIDYAPEGIRFLTTQALYTMIAGQIYKSVLEFGTPECHDGTDTLEDIGSLC